MGIVGVYCTSLLERSSLRIPNLTENSIDCKTVYSRDYKLSHPVCSTIAYKG